MSSTVRQVLHDSLVDKRHFKVASYSPNLGPNRYSDEACAGQKKSFDLRRQIMLSDDTERLHLHEITEMLSPRSKVPTLEAPLLPSIDTFNISKTS